MKNGRGDDWNDPKITSLSAARKKAAADKKSAASGKVTTRNVKELVIGAVIVAMAAGFLVHLAKPLLQAGVSLGN